MHLKRFKGAELPDVMRRVRDELGPEAVILHTKPSRPRGLLRFFRGAGVEILAAVDRSEASLSREPGAPRPTVPAWEGVRAELGEIKTLLLRFGGGRLLPAALVPGYERLLAAGVEESLARRIVEALPQPEPADRPMTPEALGRALEESAAGMIRVADPSQASRPAVVALVGPTGSGKTTTLAKLAARSLLAGAKTEILSLDDAGLGVSGHLEALSTILGVPYALALTTEELSRALEGSRARGLILVDTPGVSLRDEAGLARLRDLLRTARPSEVHLVLSATSKTADALAAIRAFGVLGSTHLLFTRLDETVSYGSLLSVSIASGLPLSYFGIGREIPNDIRPASGRDLARLALRGEREP